MTLLDHLTTACKMAPMNGEERFEEIQTEAREAGFELTSSQLRRWYRAELIGPPRQQGRGRGRGTETYYPDGTTRRVMDICRILNQYRSLRDVAWALWWDGDTIPAHIIRDQLEAVSRSLRADFGKIVGDDGIREEFREFLDDANNANIPSRSLRRARRRVGTDDFGAFLESMMLLALGQADRLNDSSVSQLDHGLGFDRGRSDLLPTGEPWLASDARSDFIAIGQLFGPDRIDKGLQIDDSELGTARDAAKAFLKVVSAMSKIINMGFERWAYGMGLVSVVLDEFAEGPNGQRRFFLLWLSLRTPELHNGMNEIASQVLQAEAAVRAIDTLNALFQSVPALGDEISVRDVIQAGFDEGKQSALQETVRRIRREHSAEIDEYLALDHKSHGSK